MPSPPLPRPPLASMSMQPGPCLRPRLQPPPRPRLSCPGSDPTGHLQTRRARAYPTAYPGCLVCPARSHLISILPSSPCSNPPPLHRPPYCNSTVPPSSPGPYCRAFDQQQHRCTSRTWLPTPTSVHHPLCPWTWPLCSLLRLAFFVMPRPQRTRHPSKNRARAPLRSSAPRRLLSCTARLTLVLPVLRAPRLALLVAVAFRLARHQPYPTHTPRIPSAAATQELSSYPRAVVVPHERARMHPRKSPLRRKLGLRCARERHALHK